jgi:hypothetical protein
MCWGVKPWLARIASGRLSRSWISISPRQPSCVTDEYFSDASRLEKDQGRSPQGERSTHATFLGKRFLESSLSPRGDYCGAYCLGRWGQFERFCKVKPSAPTALQMKHREILMDAILAALITYAEGGDVEHRHQGELPERTLALRSLEVLGLSRQVSNEHGGPSWVATDELMWLVSREHIDL